MSTGLKESRGVGRKKRERPARTVRLDADLIAMAELLARKQGATTGEYLSTVVRPIIERLYAKLVRMSSEAERSE
jgi:hypothetical protein